MIRHAFNWLIPAIILAIAALAGYVVFVHGL
jgi:hypothetical protein